MRTSEHVLLVLDTSLRIAADAVSASTQDGTRLTLPIPVSAAGKVPAHYRVFSELWVPAATAALCRWPGSAACWHRRTDACR